MKFPQKLNTKLTRYKQIATILAKYGFAEVIAGVPIARRFKLRITKRKKALSRWERIRLALEELGTSFIKLGQIMSSRNDLLPEPLLIELEKLRENVPPFPIEQAEKIILEQTGKSSEVLFRSFDKTPFASASIAQVHKATLLTGEKVVVKIRRPDIEEKIKADIEMMKGMAILIERNLKRFAPFNLTGIIAEFERSITKELDFYLEAANIERFASIFEHNNKYHVPKVYTELSSKQMLVMEYIDGISPLDIDALEAHNINPKDIAINGTNFVLEQIFKAGFFHGDPHEGNIKIMPDGKICFLDYGMMGTMTRKSRMQLGDLLIGFVRRSPEKITEAVLEITSNKHYENKSVLEDEIADLIDKYSYIPLTKLNFGKILSELMNVIFRHEIKLPSSFYMLGKTVVTIESIARQLDPDFLFADYLRPYAKSIVKERLSLKTILKDSHETLEDIVKLAKVLPGETKEILEQIRKGKATIRFAHTGLEDLTRKVQSTGNRLSFSLLTAALVIGSSIMTVSNVPPLWNGVSIVGVFGFIVSGIMAFILFMEILRHGSL